MFVTTGINDTQVNYAEPLKWVARLRATKTDDHELLPCRSTWMPVIPAISGRFGPLPERAQIIAWLISHVR